MSGQDIAPVGRATLPKIPAARFLAVFGLMLTLGYFVVLAGAYVGGNFLSGSDGKPIANDFVNVWAAGTLVRDGRPAGAYDWPVHKAAEIRAVGHDFANYYGWHYPPAFLFVAAALATLPYFVAAIVWLVATLAAYCTTLGGLLGARGGILLALACPAALWNVTAGQNGFLTATLIGGTLGLMERRPALAGVCLGLLSYKPQFGLLFPLVLIADRRWRTVAVATLVTLILAALSWLAFGSATWQAFLHWMPITGHVVLGEGAADWSRLQSVFGLVRAAGGHEALAWSVQAIATLAIAAWLVSLWRSGSPFEIKAAALAATVPLATPYVYVYDLVVLAVAAAFLLRFALANGFTAAETVGLPCAAALLLAYPYAKTQVGLAAALIVLGAISTRAVSRLHDCG